MSRTVARPGAIGMLTALYGGVRAFGKGKDLLVQSYWMRGRVGYQFLAVSGIVWSMFPADWQLSHHPPRDRPERPARWAHVLYVRAKHMLDR